MQIFEALARAIHEEGAAALVTVVAAHGSAPRDGGARMVVRPSGAFVGTIGGGALEWAAMADAARAMKAGRGAVANRSTPLGPELGQCCGGRVEWRLETFDARDLAEIAPLAIAERAGPLLVETRPTADGRLCRRAAPGAAAAEGALLEVFGEAATPLLLFGAGHVGRALVLALAPLPFRVRWIDDRLEAFPQFAPASVERVRAAEPSAEVEAAPDGAFVLVMTHSHPLDLDIAATALTAERFGYVGLIGSATKRARFLSRMRDAGLTERALSRLICPIGVPGVDDKAPASIAASVVAQLLQARSGGLRPLAPDARLAERSPRTHVRAP